MRLSATGALAALGASAAHAFSDSSPFVLFSSAKLPEPASSEQLQSSAQVVETAKDLLRSCPTSRYLLVEQPNLNAAHLRTTGAAPNLYRSLQRAEGRFSVAEVAGRLDAEELAAYIREACGGQGASVEQVGLDPLSAAASVKAIQENDHELAVFLHQYENEGSYTVIYTAGSRTEEETPKTYTAEFDDPTHMELKRQLHQSGRRANVTDSLPLFEKYQYFTPAIFMGLVALTVLLSILYTGIQALGSLSVSYGAFDKEMGPAAQKKQQ